MAIKKIILIHDDGTEIEFVPKFKTTARIMKGITGFPVGMDSNMIPNGKEALIIISAPEDVQEVLINDETLFRIEAKLNIFP